MKKGKKLLFILAAALLICFGAYRMYAGQYYHVQADAADYWVGQPQITYDESGLFSSEKWIGFGDPESETGVIFYGGAKVEEAAYIPLMTRLAEEGFYAVLVYMPDRMAILDADRALDVMEDHPQVERWFIGGHSLGGAMAAGFAAERDDISGLFLLAAYSTKAQQIPVLSLYGDRDRVLNQEKYEEYRSNLPEDTVELVIEGGSHAGFGCYGEQDGDGTAEISQREQQEIAAKAIAEWIEMAAEGRQVRAADDHQPMTIRRMAAKAGQRRTMNKKITPTGR